MTRQLIQRKPKPEPVIEWTREEINRRMLQMLDVVRGLIDLAQEENGRLKDTQPIDLTDILEKKRALIRELEGWLAQTRVQPAILALGSPELNHQLNALIQQLAPVLKENSDLLQKSLVVTKRRTQTIVRAIRETRKLPAGYSGNGNYQTAALRSYSIGNGVKA